MFKGLPCGHGALGCLDGDPPQRTCRNSRRVGKAPHLVGGDFGEAATAAEAQCQCVVRKVRERCDKIVARRELGRSPVRVEERPVFLVHVGIANQHRKNETADELPDGVVTRFGPEDGGDIRITVEFVLVVGKLSEDLRKIFHMNGLPARQTVEPPNGESLAPGRARLFREALDVRHRDEAVLGDSDADTARQFEHGKFVLWDRRETVGWQLDDP